MYFDYREKIRIDNNPDVEFNQKANYTSVVILCTPFSVLFYTEQFWFNFFHFVPLYLYFWILMSVAAKYSWYPYGSEAVRQQAGGSAFLTILLYFIFFNEGVMNEAQHVRQTANNVYSTWPYYVAIGLIAAAMISYVVERLNQLNNAASTALIIVISGTYPLLPLFIDSYWRGLFEGAIVLGAYTLIYQ